MAIDPPSDIILDVMRAADPARRQMATEKLAQTGNSEAAGVQFAAAMDVAQPANEPFSCGVPEPAGVFYHGAPKAEPPEAYKKFEAFILQSFIQSMLPKSSEANYGSGTAGEVWRSLAAEEMGNTIAESGGIGIADRMYKDALGKAATRADDAFSLAGSLRSDGPLNDWASALPYVEHRRANPDDV